MSKAINNFNFPKIYSSKLREMFCYEEVTFTPQFPDRNT